MPTVTAQEEIDTLKTTQIRGLRIGIDILQPIYSLFSDDSKGLEFVADMRVYKSIFAALEFGYNDKTSTEDYMNFTTNGTYFKIGGNYNAYKNWAGMNNEIYVGIRYGHSSFSQTLNSYTPNVYGTYFDPNTIYSDTEYPDLTANWIEFVTGMKVETFKNLYLGFSLNFKVLINSKEPENFQNLFIPGFNNVSVNNMGFGFNYTVSYLIPFTKKSK
jgi:hypothetical protein